jgi:hypothetical protein
MPDRASSAPPRDAPRFPGYAFTKPSLQSFSAQRATSASTFAPSAAGTVFVPRAASASSIRSCARFRRFSRSGAGTACPFVFETPRNAAATARAAWLDADARRG